jgi:hypothetical protein
LTNRWLNGRTRSLIRKMELPSDYPFYLPIENIIIISPKRKMKRGTV